MDREGGGSLDPESSFRKPILQPRQSSFNFLPFSSSSSLDSLDTSQSSWSFLSDAEELVHIQSKGALSRQCLRISDGRLVQLHVTIKSDDKVRILAFNWSRDPGPPPTLRTADSSSLSADESSRESFSVEGDQSLLQAWDVSRDPGKDSLTVRLAGGTWDYGKYPEHPDVKVRMSTIRKHASKVAQEAPVSNLVNYAQEADGSRSLHSALFGGLSLRESCLVAEAIAAVVVAVRIFDAGDPYLACGYFLVDQQRSSSLLLLDLSKKSGPSSTGDIKYVDLLDFCRQVIVFWDNIDPLKSRDCTDPKACAERSVSAIPYLDFIQMEEWIPPNCSRSVAVKRTWTPAPIFISHPWMGRKHPDPDKRLLYELRDALPNFLNDFAHYCIGEESEYGKWNNRYDGQVRFAVFAGMNHAEAVSFLEQNAGIWLDYLIVPNDPMHFNCRECRQRKRENILNIGYLTEISTVFFVGDSEYLKRGWILAELHGGRRRNLGRIVDGKVQPFNDLPSIVPLLTGQTRFTNRSDYQLVLQSLLEKFALGPRCWAHINAGYVKMYEAHGGAEAMSWIRTMVSNGRQLEAKESGDFSGVYRLSAEDTDRSWIRSWLKIFFRRAAMGETSSLLRGLQLLHDFELPAIHETLSRRSDLTPDECSVLAEHWHTARLDLFSCAVHGSRCTHERKVLGVSYWRELARCYQQVLGHCGLWREVPNPKLVPPEGDPLEYVPQMKLEQPRWYEVKFKPCVCGAHQVEEIIL